MHPFPYCGTAAQGRAASKSTEAFYFWHVREFNMWTYVRTAIQVTTNPAHTAFALAYTTTPEAPNNDLGVTILAVLEYCEPTPPE